MSQTLCGETLTFDHDAGLLGFCLNDPDEPHGDDFTTRAVNKLKAPWVDAREGFATPQSLVADTEDEEGGADDDGEEEDTDGQACEPLSWVDQLVAKFGEGGDDEDDPVPDVGVGDEVVVDERFRLSYDQIDDKDYWSHCRETSTRRQVCARRARRVTHRRNHEHYFGFAGGGDLAGDYFDYLDHLKRETAPLPTEFLSVQQQLTKTRWLANEFWHEIYGDTDSPPQLEDDWDYGPHYDDQPLPLAVEIDFLIAEFGDGTFGHDEPDCHDRSMRYLDLYMPDHGSSKRRQYKRGDAQKHFVAVLSI